MATYIIQITILEAALFFTSIVFNISCWSRNKSDQKTSHNTLFCDI